MTDLTLPTQSKSKRAKIRELTLAGLSPKDIVDEVNTTKEYVYKERGRLKADGLLVTHQSLSISSTTQKNEPKKEQKNMRMTESLEKERVNNYASYYNLPPLSTEDTKAMYQAFKNKENGADVIARDGINPIIAQLEHDRYLHMISRNPADLQQRIISQILNPPPHIQNLIKKSKTSLLDNEELFKLISFLKAQSGILSIRSAVSDIFARLPDGVSRISCTSCGRQAVGVVFDRTQDAGLYLHRTFATTYRCEFCKNKDIAR
jgi:hypothetical protein